MFRKLGSSGSLWKPKNPHSLEYLKYLQGVLTKNEKVTENNKKVLVEALRAIAEILIWGDQNDASVFDFFLERQMLLHFLKIMEQGNMSLNVQLLQTLNILFENIRHETSLYFLLSNNHVNSIISHKFDLHNDEIMAYYISFLKTLSFKLNAATIHFFFNETTEEFPLLIEVLKLYNWNESMVRIAVRNILLNIVRVQDDSMIIFVTKHTKANRSILRVFAELFAGLCYFVATHIKLAPRHFAVTFRNFDVSQPVFLTTSMSRRKLNPVYEQSSNDKIHESIIFSLAVTTRYLSPLLLSSLSPRRNNHSLLLTPVSALFFFSEFLLVVRHHETIHNFLSSFLFDTQKTLKTHWIRHEENYCLEAVMENLTSPVQDEGDPDRVFFDTLLEAFDASQKDDSLAFYGLMLIYSMFQNKADVGELLSAANFPVLKQSSPTGLALQNLARLRIASTTSMSRRPRAVTEIGVEATEEEEMFHDVPEQIMDDLVDDVLVDGDENSRKIDDLASPTRSRFQSAADELPPNPGAVASSTSESSEYDSRLFEALSSIIQAVGSDENRIRPISLELACLVIRQILMTVDDEKFQTNLAKLCSDVRHKLLKVIGQYVNGENLFLEWFEDEYAEFEVNHINFDIIGYEMLLPPAATPLSNLPLHKRLSSGFEERLRTQIIFYLHIRKLERDLTGEPDTELPVKVFHSGQDPVVVGDCINLHNSDLLSCTVVPQQHCSLGKPGDRLSRFLVTDRLQLILVEPDSRKAGWAIVRFVGLLQDMTISGDSADSKVLHVVVEGQPSRLKKRQSVLTAKFIFDDHIRCMAAKQRLSKGRQTARGLKLGAIFSALGVPRVDPSQMTSASPRVNPFRIVKGCAPGSVRKTVSTSSSGRLPAGYYSTNIRSASRNSPIVPEDPTQSRTNS
uniref:FPL domain-containing protein n=1 Tax=Caenorhabditis japonica TaxID=281687 RepID=A0A8R1I2N6_CAEJA